MIAATGLMAGRASQPRTLVAVLAAGQLIGHAAMAVSGHAHATPHVPGQSMVLAHAAAVVAGATLMVLAQRLIDALCRVVRRCVAIVCSPPDVPSSPWRFEPQVVQQILLSSPISHRGPPVCAQL